MDRNPLEHVEPMGADYRARDILTAEELRLLFPEDDSECLAIWRSRKYYTMFLTMATTGCRIGEARALQWRH
ncbi:MAG: hypothetical protein NTU62_09805, partial [Spirochaetes bacterium]|nr:hypothetical protein [Spirochaetota bacterium]